MDSKLKEGWGKDEYYEVARRGSLDIGHPAMRLLKKIVTPSAKILDMGCGEGTRLNYLCENPENCFGIDISGKAIELAKKNYPGLNFVIGNLEHLPYKEESFDLVYSAFVFEHLDNPEKVIKEGIRVLKKRGRFLIVAPNFGAPNRVSPPFRGNKLEKLILGFVSDFIHSNNLHWNKVKPIATSKKYDIDWDTRVEPYLGSLIRFFKSEGLQVTYFSSCWVRELPSAGFLQRIFRFLGELNLYPFKFWGPHFVLVAKK